MAKKPSPNRRVLRIECLEDRRLLANDGLIDISGPAVIDFASIFRDPAAVSQDFGSRTQAVEEISLGRLLPEQTLRVDARC